MKTISQFWNGNIDPIKHLGSNNPEMRQLENLLDKNTTKLRESLNEKEKEIFEKYTDCVNEYMFISNEEAFFEGFCLGMKIFTEALNGAEDLT